MAANNMRVMFDKFVNKKTQRSIADELLVKFVPKWIRKSYQDNNVIGLYTIDGFRPEEVRELLACVSAEIEAHKRRRVPTKDQWKNRALVPLPEEPARDAK